MAVSDVRENVDRSRAGKSAQDSSFQVLSHTYPAGFFGSLHRHDGEEILYVMSGSVRLSIDGHRKTYREGDIAFIPAHAEHGLVTLLDSTIDVYHPTGVTTYLTLPSGEQGDNEIVVLESVPLASSQQRGAGRYAPSPEVGGRHIGTTWSMR